MDITEDIVRRIERKEIKAIYIPLRGSYNIACAIAALVLKRDIKRNFRNLKIVFQNPTEEDVLCIASYPTKGITVSTKFCPIKNWIQIKEYLSVVEFFFHLLSKITGKDLEDILNKIINIKRLKVGKYLFNGKTATLQIIFGHYHQIRVAKNYDRDKFLNLLLEYVKLGEPKPNFIRIKYGEIVSPYYLYWDRLPPFLPTIMFNGRPYTLEELELTESIVTVSRMLRINNIKKTLQKEVLRIREYLNRILRNRSLSEYFTEYGKFLKVSENVGIIYPALSLILAKSFLIPVRVLVIVYGKFFSIYSKYPSRLVELSKLLFENYNISSSACDFKMKIPKKLIKEEKLLEILQKLYSSSPYSISSVNVSPGESVIQSYPIS